MKSIEPWDAEAEWCSILDSLVTTRNLYCSKCGRPRSIAGSLGDATSILLIEGWTSPARLEIICPTCTEKAAQQIEKQ